MSAQPSENIEHFLDFVKGQIRFHRIKAETFAEKHPPRAAKHQQFADEFSSLADFLSERPALSNHHSPGILALTPEDLEGLPQELLEEINVSDADRLHFTIRDVLEENGGRASLDQIIIGVYRKTGQILKRSRATNIVWRMSTKGLLFPLAGVKAAYTLHEEPGKPDSDQADKSETD